MSYQHYANSRGNSFAEVNNIFIIMEWNVYCKIAVNLFNKLICLLFSFCVVSIKTYTFRISVNYSNDRQWFYSNLNVKT